MNAIFKLPLSARLALLLLILFGLWQLLDSNQPTETRQADVERTSDYAMTGFELTIMDAQGRPSRVIRGDEMAHYPDDDSTEIINPDADFISPDGDDWHAVSEHGKTHGKGEHIVLTGNVIITNVDQPAIKLLTDKLHLDTEQDTAYTDLPVLMRSPRGDTHSIGMHAVLNEKTVNLHSQVKGKYDAPPAD